MKKILTFFLINFFFVNTDNIYSNNIDFEYIRSDKQENKSDIINYNINLEEEIEKQIKYEISINSEYKIDLNEIIEKLKIIYPEKNFFVNWTYQKEEFKNNSFIKTFKDKWIKEIKLNLIQSQKTTQIDEKTNEEIEVLDEKVIFEKNINLLVYEKTIPFIISDEINKKELDYYLEFAKKDWIFIYKIWPLSKTDIELTNIPNLINKYEKIWWLKSDYITIWWWRNFIFDIISKINRDLILSENEKSYNIVSISPFNITIMKNYLDNFLANKKWINSILLLWEDSKFALLKENINEFLIKELTDNKHNFINLNLKDSKVSNILFLSNFINKLSNLWYSTNTIYIMLIIPFVLIITIIFKHFIWISPIWLILPLFITILLFKLWFIFTFIFILFFIFFNLTLSYFIWKHNLHYAPKITFLLLLNIVFLILWIIFFYNYNIIPLDFNDVLYFVIFIIISEKFINIIISKDIIEYKNPFINTIIISLFSYFILQINFIKIIILSYPEIMLWLIPISFLVWKFSWLRVSEYFRFKEIIKSTEEEE